MLKLTEAELAETGFRKSRKSKSWVLWVGGMDIEYQPSAGKWLAATDLDLGATCYPQTKEDLLTLIRLFTPPREVKDAS